MRDIPERPLDPQAVASAEANLLPPRDERRMRQILEALCDPTRVKIVQALSQENTLAAPAETGAWGCGSIAAGAAGPAGTTVRGRDTELATAAMGARGCATSLAIPQEDKKKKK